MPVPAVTLWAVPSSHPCRTVQRALELKAIPFRRIDLVPVVHRIVVRARFGARTVPAVRLPDGRRVQGSREIITALDELRPDVPLRPADPDRRAQVVRAEEWGDQVLQPIGRRLGWWVLGAEPDALPGYAAGTRMVPPSPAWVVRALAAPIARAGRHLNGVSEPVIRADLLHLPAHLDRVDAWIEAGVLGGEQLNAADLQIAATLRLLLTLEDLRPVIDPRPCGALARRVFAAWPGAGPAGAVPPSWLPAG